MHSGPSKTAERAAAILIPPACREEVLGDLHERYSAPGQYRLDVLRTVPLVVLSRIRRTADPPVLLLQAFTLYASFLGAAWLMKGTLLSEQWELLRLAIPPAMVIPGLILEDAYSQPGNRSYLKLIRGPLAGIALALLFQGVLWAGYPELAIPGWVALYGFAMSLLLSSAVRLLFPPSANQFQG